MDVECSGIVIKQALRSMKVDCNKKLQREKRYVQIVDIARNNHLHAEGALVVKAISEDALAYIHMHCFLFT